MKIQTEFGPLAIQGGFASSEKEAIISAAKEIAQGAWTRGEDLPLMTADQLRLHPAFMRQTERKELAQAGVPGWRIELSR